jgi:hypothetical protein
MMRKSAKRCCSTRPEKQATGNRQQATEIRGAGDYLLRLLFFGEDGTAGGERFVVEAGDVAASAFGCVESFVGFMLQDIPGQIGTSGRDGDAEAGGDAGEVGSKLEAMVGDGEANALDGGDRGIGVEAGKDEHELFATDAAGNVGFANHGAQEYRKFAEHRVAAGVAVAVVEELEEVEVENDDGEVVAGARVTGELDFSGGLQSATIEELGERVDHGLAIEMDEEAGVHHPDKGEREDGAGDDVDDAVGDFGGWCNLRGHFAGDEKDGDAGELDGGVDAEEDGDGAARPASFAIRGGEEEKGGESGFEGEDRVLERGARAHVVGDAPGEEKRESAEDEEQTEPAGADTAADEVGDAGIEAGVANGGGFHEDAHGEPVGQPVSAEIEQGATETGDVAKGEPAEAFVGAVLQRHAGEDDGEAGELNVLDESNGVGQHDWLLRVRSGQALRRTRSCASAGTELGASDGGIGESGPDYLEVISYYSNGLAALGNAR